LAWRWLGSPPCPFYRHGDELAVADAALGDHMAGKVLDAGRLAAQHGDLIQLS
jgi:hypothetical protein